MAAHPPIRRQLILNNASHLDEDVNAIIFFCSEVPAGKTISTRRGLPAAGR